mmetsp:Transcript_56430/g.157278  ORF Transcript_56430/g.157278 Transcript_56430/m.157278 type:complete len:384 (+) Transcript_56430:122-1273(+)
MGRKTAVHNGKAQAPNFVIHSPRVRPDLSERKPQKVCPLDSDQSGEESGPPGSSPQSDALQQVLVSGAAVTASRGLRTPPDSDDVAVQGEVSSKGVACAALATCSFLAVVCVLLLAKEFRAASRPESWRAWPSFEAMVAENESVSDELDAPVSAAFEELGLRTVTVPGGAPRRRRALPTRLPMGSGGGVHDGGACVDVQGSARCQWAKPCCPGGPGGAHCGTSDCRRSAGGKGYECPGTWTAQNCARTCGLCNPCDGRDEEHCVSFEACCPGGVGGPQCGPEDCSFNAAAKKYTCPGARMKRRCARVCGLCEPCWGRNVSSESMCRGSEACCPGAAGNPHCSPSDCAINPDRRTYTCSGKYMTRHCAHTCGLCSWREDARDEL